MTLLLAPTETTEAYRTALGTYLHTHGRPVALYSDRHSIFRNNLPETQDEPTQFGRALKTLDIEAIHARSPQAKGRVERANQTLQDRLVKELRLQNINDIESGNRFLEGYRGTFNRRFAVAPQNPNDAHRPVLHDDDEVRLILSIHHHRQVTKDLLIRFNNVYYQLQGVGKGHRIKRKTLTLCEHFDGTLVFLHEGKALDYRALTASEHVVALADEKSVHQHVDAAKDRQKRAKPWKPGVDHPWKRGMPTPTPA